MDHCFIYKAGRKPILRQRAKSNKIEAMPIAKAKKKIRKTEAIKSMIDDIQYNNDHRTSHLLTTEDYEKGFFKSNAFSKGNDA